MSNITGIPFGGENLLASEWREISDNKRFNFFDVILETSLNQITIKKDSRIRYGEFRLLFGTDEILTLPTSMESDKEIYIYVTANQVTSEFGDLMYSDTYPTNNDQNGLFDIVIATISARAGITNIVDNDITLNQAFYEITKQNGGAFNSSLISATRLKVGIHEADNLTDTFGTGTIQVFKKDDNSRYMIGFSNNGEIYTSTSIEAPAIWKKLASSEELQQAIDNLQNDKIVYDSVNLFAGDSITISELNGQHPYEAGYRWLLITHNVATVSPTPIPILETSNAYTTVTNLVSESDGEMRNYNYAYNLTLQNGVFKVEKHVTQIMSVSESIIAGINPQSIKYIELRK